MIYKLLLSVVAGILVGFDRERKAKPTGIRTCSMVSLGTCLFSIITQLLPSTYPDRGHIAANIVQGIGFLGAGSVMVNKNRIVGLTSASIIWVLAAIGMAIGFGYYVVAFETVALILGTVWLTDWAQNKNIFKGEK